MASPKYARSPNIKRILREAAELAQSPSPDFHAAPASDSDLFDWHFTIRGPPSSAFAKGIYHGRILLPPTYPLRPPSFRFLNSSGRFEVNREICLSISGHHEETWMPAWGVRTALMALRSFMETDPKGQLGGMECTEIEREKFARESVTWTCSVCKKKNEDILREGQASCREQGLSANKNDSNIPLELQAASKSVPVENEEKVANCGISSETTPQFTEDEYPKEPFTTKRPAVIHSTFSETSKAALITPSSSRRAPSADLNAEAAQYHQTSSVRLTNEQSPLWIDRAIATIIICLVAMVMKVLLGIGRNFPWESRQE